MISAQEARKYRLTKKIEEIDLKIKRLSLEYKSKLTINVRDFNDNDKDELYNTLVKLGFKIDKKKEEFSGGNIKLDKIAEIIIEW